MSLGIILSLAGIVLLGIASTTQKFIAEKYENYLALFVQYIGMVVFAAIGVLIFTQIENISFRPQRDINSLLILLGTGIAGFFGILFLRKGFEKMNSGIVLIIANLSVFLMYFINLYLFDGGEMLPLVQIILAIVFFIVISQFLTGKSLIRRSIKNLLHGTKQLANKNLANPKIKFNKAALYPMVTAICRSIFFVGNTYFVKEGILHPIQSVLFTEGTIFLTTIAAFLIVYKAKFTPLKKIQANHLRIFAVGTLVLVTGNFLLYYAYLDTPANIVNVIRLFSIMTTSLFARIMLKDKLSKRNGILMIIALSILILFVFAEDILKLF